MINGQPASQSASQPARQKDGCNTNIFLASSCVEVFSDESKVELIIIFIDPRIVQSQVVHKCHRIWK